MQQSLEARVVVEILEFRIYVKDCHFWISLLNATLQPGEHFISIVKAAIEYRKVVRRNMLLLR